MAASAPTVLAVLGGPHPGLHPLADGLGALGFLVVLLFLVTRLNRDR